MSKKNHPSKILIASLFYHHGSSGASRKPKSTKLNLAMCHIRYWRCSRHMESLAVRSAPTANISKSKPGQISHSASVMAAPGNVIILPAD